MDVLFMHWFCQDVNYPAGWSEKCLLQLQFSQQESINTFSFVINSDTVIHGVHIIPAFGFRHTYELLGLSQAHQQKGGKALDDDWRYYISIRV